jgi:imidazolonepropionase-like amidohydrolase
MSENVAASTLLCAARLVDGLSDVAKFDHAVLLEGGRIRAVGVREEIQKEMPPGTEVVDLGDACITPGLIDNHTHVSLAADGRSYIEFFADTDEMMVLAGAMNLRRHQAAGVTTIRDNGARNMVGFAIKEGLRRGYITGSRILVSGRSITCTEGHFHMCNEVADGVEEMRRSVRRLAHQGADFIKVMATGGGTVGTVPRRASYSVEELRAAVCEARHFDLLTAAHCRATEGMQHAVEAGIDLIEHAEFLGMNNQMRFDSELAEKMVECGTWASPTLQAWTGYPRIVALEAKAEAGTITLEEEQTLKQANERAETRLEVVRRMVDSGLKERILPGTDCGVGNLIFGHLDYDLQLLVRAGFTPGEALLSATRISAEAIGMVDQLGTIELGKIADLAVFAGDPTKDVRALSEVVAVFQGGQRVR